MATHKLGKLKINRSENGFSFRFGDGRIHQLKLPFGKKRGGDDYDGDDYNDAYNNEADYADDGDYGYEGDGGYAGRFSRTDNQGDYDDGYDYDDGGDGYYDDGGDYGDDDYDAGYDDRYQDEDAEDYDDGGYADESPLMRFVDEHDWVTYLLLFVLPPLGIYLLWRRRRFERPIRMGVSAVSGVWFIVLLILLFSAIFSGSGDTTTNPPIAMTTPTPTAVAPAATDEAVDALGSLDSALGGDNGSLTGGDLSTDGAQTSPEATSDPLSLDVTVTATPIASSNTAGGTGAAADVVYTTATGMYYHNNRACTNIEEGAALSTVTKAVAIQSGKNACPICYPDQKTYYATANGKYYHVDSTCSGMTDAATITEEAAKAQGKTACPVCITQEVNTLDSKGLKFATSATTDKSGVTVYATADGKYFHIEATCSGMKNPTSGGLLKAMLAGKTACPTCCKALGNQVYCTQGGKYYHNKSDCSKMQNAFRVTLAEALILGKSKCGTCWGASTGGSASSSSGGVQVYATKNGKYYHTNATCSGMQNAARYSLKSMLQAGKTACPVCAAGANTVAYATKNGKYYHSNATCSGMTDAVAGTVAQALAYGKTRCPNCWSSAATSSTASTAESGYVYCTQKGTYYHTKADCSGMQNPNRVTIADAVKAGKKACPTCASAANYTVYSTDSGKYYHRTSTCSGMTNAKQRTVQEAMVMGQTACPTCIGAYLTKTKGGGVTNASTRSFTKGSTSTAAKINEQVKEKVQKTLVSSGIYKSGTSGIKVYATPTSTYYHVTKNCSGMTGASHITLETALNYGKKACPKCASSASTTVYANAGSKYYHYSKTCAGSGAVKGNRASALALGLDPCPYCVTKTRKVNVGGSEAYKPGKSGIKVYATVTGKYYHVSKTHAGSGASKIALETALNYGKTACPTCSAPASKTVYSALTDKYYHVSKSCAGSGALKGTFAQAKAMGKKECPRCIGGNGDYEESDIKYPAPGDTTVYVNLDSDLYYYHKNSKCSEASMSGGTGVMLDFVLELGYRACPYCNPPTSAK